MRAAVGPGLATATFAPPGEPMPLDICVKYILDWILIQLFWEVGDRKMIEMKCNTVTISEVEGGDSAYNPLPRATILGACANQLHRP